ncbi:MAG: hypothetical protein LBG79_02645 [Spirochaetaceae bacterium]|jgi:hypothetical protein|nr:hypothetical protein [Spirochaetaceae bacterium]
MIKLQTKTILIFCLFGAFNLYAEEGQAVVSAEGQAAKPLAVLSDENLAAPAAAMAEEINIVDDEEETEVVIDYPAPSTEESAGRTPVFLQMREADVLTGLPKQKRFEFGFLFLDAGASNNWLSYTDFIKNSFLFNSNLDVSGLLGNGAFNIESQNFLKPLFVRFRTNEHVLVEIALESELNFRLDMSDRTLNSLKYLMELQKNPPVDIAAKIGQLRGEISAAGSAFAALSAGVEIIPSKKFWFRIMPALFTPIFYLPQSDIHLEGHYDAASQSAEFGNSSGDLNFWMINNDNVSIGFDITLEGRFALWPLLDIGAFVEHIPILQAGMNSSSFEFDVDFIVSAHDQSMKMQNNTGFSPNSGLSRRISRPVRYGIYTIIKPFSSRLLLIRPEAGFSTGTVFDEQIFNWGIESRLNFPKILSVSAGVKDFEKTWTNYIKLVLDFKYMAFQLGAGLRGNNFINSWNSKSLWASFGIKVCA